MERRKLTEPEIADALTGLADWTFDGAQIRKTYTFDTYASGAVFALAVAHLADRMDHHPDLHLGYRKVTVALNTHDVGGISPLDFALAQQIEPLR